MYNLNITQLINSTEPQQIAYISKEFVAPTILIIIGMFLTILLVSGLLIVKGRESKNKFLSIWFLNAIFSVIMVTFFLLTPNSIINFIKDLFLNLNK